MFVKGQKIRVSWTNSYSKYYQGLGYPKLKQGEEFEINAEQALSSNTNQVDVICDECNEIYNISIRQIYKNRKKNNNIDLCNKCFLKKNKKVNKNLNEIDYIEEDETIITNNAFTDDFLISEFFRYENLFGHYPTKPEIDGTNGFPSASAYTEHWGTWNNFLKAIDILGENGWYKKDEETIKEIYPNVNYTMKNINDRLLVKRSIYDLQKKIKQMGLIERNLFIVRIYNKSLPAITLFYNSLNDLKNDIGKCPTAIDYDAYTKLNRLPSRRLAEKLLKKPFSKICKELFSETNKEIKTNEELLNELRELKSRLGRTPMANELHLYGLPEKKTFMRRFKMTYQELINSLGWTLSSKKMNFKTKDELLSDYKMLYNELERLPNHQDLQDSKYTSSIQTYTKYFGSLKNVWDILEIDFDVNQDISSGIVSKNKNGDICRSTQELEIGNILIDNGIYYIPEMRYSDLDVNLINKWKMDWYLNDFNIYIEYFGLYDEKHLKRNTRIGKYSRKVKKKLEYCLNNNINIIALYREDLNDNYLGLIKKFNNYNINLVV
jgi:hypothetical protein